MGTVSVLPPASAARGRRNVLDRAHQGDIKGALGQLPVHENVGLGRRRLSAFLAVMGPGLVVMVANNDAGTIATSAQAGQNYGFLWVWVPIVLAAAIFVIQEMAARLGAVTGAGHARLIFERFGRVWGFFALGDLLLLNTLLVVTEFIGLQFGLGYFGLDRRIAVVAGLAVVLAMSFMGDFRTWERTAFGLVAASLAVLPLLLFVQLRSHRSLHEGHRALVAGHLSLPVGHDPSMLFALAMIGTMLAPWQLFFQQSNVVDKRITARWLRYERIDTLVGTAVFAFIAMAMIAVCAYAFDGTALHGRFIDAAVVAHGLHHRVGSWAGTVFAISLIDGSILGAGVISLSTGYAVGDVRGWRHSLHRRWTDARMFYGSQAACIVLAAVVVLVAHDHLGVITVAVQALSAVLFPSAGLFLILLCNDPAVLGPWVNSRVNNVLATLLLCGLLVISALSVLRTVFPRLDMDIAASVVLVPAVVALGGMALRSRVTAATARSGRDQWSMPPVEELPPPRPSPGRTMVLVTLRFYLGLAAVALVVAVVRAAS